MFAMWRWSLEYKNVFPAHYVINNAHSTAIYITFQEFSGASSKVFVI